MACTSSPPATTCAKCSRPTDRACFGCKDAPALHDGVRSVFYCSSACQKAHWKVHKGDCKVMKERKILYRVGDTLQKMFYLYRERVFDKKIAKIEKKDGKLLIHDRDFNTEELSKVITEIEMIKPVPHEMCENEEDKKAVLVHLACSDAVAWMHHSVKFMLSDYVSEFGEVCVSLKNNKREAIGVNINGVEDGSFDHDLMMLKLKGSGEIYALDLSSAQFGYYHPVTPWFELVATRVKNLVRRPDDKEYNYFGGWHDRLLDRLDPSLHPPTGGLGPVTYSLNLHVSPVLKEGMEGWLRKKALGLEEMMVLPQRDFEAKQKDLLAHIDECVEAKIVWLANFAKEARARNECVQNCDGRVRQRLQTIKAIA
ncbi:hypothetical protein DL98DRAFT_590250 [Cadophora sp. DSE1049]|nr:hypothetical protein DL98DRAFT_590250 [Cadophora sp. DSE1049]